MFRNLTFRRVLGSVLGNVGIGLGVSIFLYSGMGLDPYSSMCMSLSEVFSMKYGTFLLLFNFVLFAVELIFGRKYIGLGTLLNWVFVGYIVQFFQWLVLSRVPEPGNLGIRFLIMIPAILIISLAVSLYQIADVGVSPYDSMALIMTDHFPIKYFWNRIIADVLCCLVGVIACGAFTKEFWAAHTGYAIGQVGLGTVLCAFCLGPFVSFFNEKISKPFINGGRKKGTSGK